MPVSIFICRLRKVETLSDEILNQKESIQRDGHGRSAHTLSASKWFRLSLSVSNKSNLKKKKKNRRRNNTMPELRKKNAMLHTGSVYT